MKPMKWRRYIIYPKDVALIYGFTEKAARNKIQKIKETIGKESHQPLTIAEFCAYTGMKEDEVRDIIM
jgi:hypothetical protein